MVSSTTTAPRPSSSSSSSALPVGGGGGGDEEKGALSQSQQPSPRPRRRTSALIVPKIQECDGEDRTVRVGIKDTTRCDNTLITYKYTPWNFLPLTVGNEFRKFTNAYFLFVAFVTVLGQNNILFSTQMSPVAIFAQLIFFTCIAISMELSADLKRRKNDHETNTYPCIELVTTTSAAQQPPIKSQRASRSSFASVTATKQLAGNGDEKEKENEETNSDPSVIPWQDIVVPGTDGTDVTVQFRSIPRAHIRQGQLIVIRNREVIPADTVLLTSSGDLGCAYIETSSIDGETNLKIRNSAKLKLPTNPTTDGRTGITGSSKNTSTKESMEEQIQRIAVISALGCRDGDENIAVLTTEAPNAHINTFSGKLTMGANKDHQIIPLDGDHLLLRGAMLRNTEWAIGVVAFTGTDTKLSQNSIESPKKFSQMDHFVNRCVISMLGVELVLIVLLSTMSIYATSTAITNDNELWYVGIYSHNATTAVPKWPYLANLAAPTDWEQAGPNWFSSALGFVVILQYFIPLSMVLCINLVLGFYLYLVHVDLDMYDSTTNTCAEPRSTIVTDLGQIQYIFSDKTGTLTQNVMRFKRCSIDGYVYGSPIAKARPSAQTPSATTTNNSNTVNVSHHDTDDDDDQQPTEFQPVVQALGSGNQSMSFNAELFLRVMSLCHTVVVEKDLDLPTRKSVSTKNNGDEKDNNDLENPNEEQHTVGSGGAPYGYAYQAESPDEGALVSEASETFGFQVFNRDSTGIQLKCDHPTLFRDAQLIEGLKSGKLNPKTIAADTAAGNTNEHTHNWTKGDGLETWAILAVNKFDSTRKRMSILLRSPPEMGSAPILFCKGADSAMLDPEIRAGATNTLYSVIEDDLDDDGDNCGNRATASHSTIIGNTTIGSDFNMATTLGMESHLGEFASEGLRTLVLGVRFLTDDECNAWLETHAAATTAMKGRAEKLTAAAAEIERELHIVGATAIEDKLQVGVPATIANLGQAGIKLWVLTGDKRETAIEIGYSTKVLTPSMHLTQIADRGTDFVRAQCAMEFMRLVKAGKLSSYQRAVVDQNLEKSFVRNTLYRIGRVLSSFVFIFKKLILETNIFLRGSLGMKRIVQQERLEMMVETEQNKRETPTDLRRRRNVRDRAEDIIKQYRKSHPVVNENETELSSDVLPRVFTKARSSKIMLDIHKSSYGNLGDDDNRQASSLSQPPGQEVTLSTLDLAERQRVKPSNDSDDLLSLKSFVPSNNTDESKVIYDKKKRTFLERAFAADRDVRKGKLIKHLKKEKRNEVLSSSYEPHAITPTGEGPRALVIEGAALQHCQGDSELEEIVFNIASQCDAVIACRVTPRQKAQLVRLVRHYVVPEPVTLGIGDGANDVGMIHEAHVGIGISGKEGKQAVNASDFSIGQFRFLENLILHHGRPASLRMSTVALYSFYKNLVVGGCMIWFNAETLFSQTLIFDQWVLAMFNFVLFFPIFFIGMFDRDLEKSYVTRNPEVYKVTQEKEHIAPRRLLRWFVIAALQVVITYRLLIGTMSAGGGDTSGFKGLMRNKSSIGDGQVSDLQSVGTTIYNCCILVLTYNVLYETKSIINGKWPTAFVSCFRKDTAANHTKYGGFVDRLPYTWYGVIFGSIGLIIFGLFVYSEVGAIGGPQLGTLFLFVGVPNHVLGASGMNYVMMLFIPIAGIALELFGKVFSNMFYPSQNQIHIERQSEELQRMKKHGLQHQE